MKEWRNGGEEEGNSGVFVQSGYDDEYILGLVCGVGDGLRLTSIPPPTIIHDPLDLFPSLWFPPISPLLFLSTSGSPDADSRLRECWKSR
jgi:hypothetical protein